MLNHPCLYHVCPSWCLGKLRAWMGAKLAATQPRQDRGNVGGNKGSMATICNTSAQLSCNITPRATQQNAHAAAVAKSAFFFFFHLPQQECRTLTVIPALLMLKLNCCTVLCMGLHTETVQKLKLVWKALRQCYRGESNAVRKVSLAEIMKFSAHLRGSVSHIHGVLR